MRTSWLNPTSTPALALSGAVMLVLAALQWFNGYVTIAAILAASGVVSLVGLFYEQQKNRASAE